MPRRRNETSLVILGLLVLAGVFCGGPCALIGIMSRSQGPSEARVAEISQQPSNESLPANVLTPVSQTVVSAPESHPVNQAVVAPSTTSPPPSKAAAPAIPATVDPPLLPEVTAEFIVEEPTLALRQWTSTSGSFHTSAKFAGIIDGQVKLEKAEGEVIVPLDKLSVADRQFVKETIRVDAAANVIIGKVVGITDGDTLTVVDEEKQQHKIRLEGIDTPESGQEFGTRAKQALSEKVFGKSPWTEWREKDRYGRTLGHVYLDGRHINLEIVAEGYAWHYKQYNSDPRLANAEIVARQKRLGLWSDDRAIPPWEFRNGPQEPRPAASPRGPPAAKAATSAPSDGAEIVFVTNTGGKYHTSGCRYLSKSKIPISLGEARQRYGPCSVCKPPR